MPAPEKNGLSKPERPAGHGPSSAPFVILAPNPIGGMTAMQFNGQRQLRDDYALAILSTLNSQAVSTFGQDPIEVSRALWDCVEALLSERSKREWKP